MSFRACRGITITQIVVIEILRRVAPQNDKKEESCHICSESLNSWCRNPHYFNTIANKTKIGKNKRKSSTELFSSLIVLDLARTCGKIATSAAALKFLPIESYVCMVLKYSGRGEVSEMHLQASLTGLVL